MTENVVLDVTSDEWEEEVLGSEIPVAVDFWHENCTWCNRLDPIYQRVAKDYQGKIRFAKLHVFRENEIATRYGISGTPTIKFFCAGREVYEIVGYRPPDVLRQEMDKVVASYRECLDSTTPLKESSDSGPRP